MLPPATHPETLATAPPAPALSTPTVVVLAGLLVGTLDISAAFTSFYLSTGKNPLLILQGIASGLLGPAAFAGGAGTMALGLLIHYFVAISFTVLFFGVCRKVDFMGRHPVVAGVLYGLFMWAVMNRVVVPLSQIQPRPFHPLAALREALILVCMIGLPLAWLAKRHFQPRGSAAAAELGETA